jgi:glutamate dehydrogenase (NAD(P)+)
MVFAYTDPEEKFNGWLVIDGAQHTLCAGGMRVQPGLTRDHVMAMAHNMTMKMRICGLPINGAKCGIDYPPNGPGKRAAMTRFMAAIKPFIEECYSMGPDLNTTMDELESIAHELTIPSVKMAIAKAQGLDMDAFLRRYALLSRPAIGDWTLGRLRAGFGVAMAALATLQVIQGTVKGARVAVQGFGNLAKAAIIGLTEAGAIITAIADAEKCVTTSDNQGLPIYELINAPGTLIPNISTTKSLRIEEKETILGTPCDLLILAAVENVITCANAGVIKAKAVIPGANLAVTKDGDEALYAAGIVVLPSFVAGCGGSLSMNGLFGPSVEPTPRQVLNYIADTMSAMVHKILHKSSVEAINPTSAAHLICKNDHQATNPRPYSYSGES